MEDHRKRKMIYNGILILSIINMLLTFYFRGNENIVRNLCYVFFSLCLILRDKYAMWRKLLDFSIILLAIIFFYTDWFIR